MAEIVVLARPLARRRARPRRDPGRCTAQLACIPRGEITLPSPRAAASSMLASISASVESSCPRQAASTIAACRDGGRCQSPRDRVGLLDQRRRGRELCGVDLSARVIGERYWKGGQRTGIAGKLDRVGGHLMPRRVVPELMRDGAGEPQEPWSLLHGARVVRKRAHRSPEQRHGGGVALGEPDRKTIQQQVDRSRRLWGRRALAGRPSRFPHFSAMAHAAREDRRSERLEVCLARQCRVERLKPLGGVEQQLRSVVARACGA